MNDYNDYPDSKKEQEMQPVYRGHPGDYYKYPSVRHSYDSEPRGYESEPKRYRGSGHRSYDSEPHGYYSEHGSRHSGSRHSDKEFDRDPKRCKLYCCFCVCVCVCRGGGAELWGGGSSGQREDNYWSLGVPGGEAGVHQAKGRVTTEVVCVCGGGGGGRVRGIPGGGVGVHQAKGKITTEVGVVRSSSGQREDYYWSLRIKTELLETFRSYFHFGSPGCILNNAMNQNKR